MDKNGSHGTPGRESSLRKAPADFRNAFTNRGEMTSLKEWNDRMKSAYDAAVLALGGYSSPSASCNRCGGLGYIQMTDGLGQGSRLPCDCQALQSESGTAGDFQHCADCHTKFDCLQHGECVRKGPHE